jgi:hypothetical protein
MYSIIDEDKGCGHVICRDCVKREINQQEMWSNYRDEFISDDYTWTVRMEESYKMSTKESYFKDLKTFTESHEINEYVSEYYYGLNYRMCNSSNDDGYDAVRMCNASTETGDIGGVKSGIEDDLRMEYYAVYHRHHHNYNNYDEYSDDGEYSQMDEREKNYWSSNEDERRMMTEEMTDVLESERREQEETKRQEQEREDEREENLIRIFGY